MNAAAGAERIPGLTDDPIAVALIGIGNSGRFYHLPHLEDRAKFDLRVVVADHPSTVSEVADDAGAEWSTDWHRAVARDDIELVVIATPHHLHHPIALEAIRRGKNVLVEKPMTSRLADARGLAREAASFGVRLFVHHQRRWEADFQELQGIVRSGELGRIWRIDVVRSHQGPYRNASKNHPHDGSDIARWPLRRDSGGGIAELVGPHPVDQLLMLAGRPFRSVSGRVHVAAGDEVEDWIGIDVGFGNELTGHVEVFRWSGIAPPRFRVQGADGVAVATDGTSIDVVQRTGTRRRVEGLAKPGTLGDEIYADIYDTLRRGGAPRVTPEQACDVVEVLELARRSAADDGRILGRASGYERTSV